MNGIWCVVEYDSDGSCSFPEFFNSRNEADLYINNSAIDEYTPIEKYPDSTIEVNCATDLYAQVGTDKHSRIWKGFEVTDKILSVMLLEIMNKKKENKNV